MELLKKELAKIQVTSPDVSLLPWVLFSCVLVAYMYEMEGSYCSPHVMLSLSFVIKILL